MYRRLVDSVTNNKKTDLFLAWLKSGTVTDLLRLDDYLMAMFSWYIYYYCFQRYTIQMPV
jgi:hypothetical protein